MGIFWVMVEEMPLNWLHLQRKEPLLHFPTRPESADPKRFSLLRDVNFSLRVSLFEFRDFLKNGFELRRFKSISGASLVVARRL